MLIVYLHKPHEWCHLWPVEGRWVLVFVIGVEAHELNCISHPKHHPLSKTHIYKAKDSAPEIHRLVRCIAQPASHARTHPAHSLCCNHLSVLGALFSPK